MARRDEPSRPWLNGPIAEDERHGRGLGPTLGMDMSVEHEREELERCLKDRAEHAAEVQAGGDVEPGSGAAGGPRSGGLGDTHGGALLPDLNDSVLKAPGVGGAGHDFGTGPTAGSVGSGNGSGFGASLGQGRNAPPEFRPPGGDQPIGRNEQQDARMAHGLAQGGAGPSKTAPDQTRAEGDFGSINNTDGL